MKRPSAAALSRRQFLGTAAAGAGLALLGRGAEAAPAAAGKRPNILYIMTDQQRWDMMSCAGNQHLRTPALDSLAANGARFDLAYSANPVCVPARVSMITGRMPSHFGVETNVTSLPAGYAVDPAQCMGSIFRRAGYETAYGGKVHLPFGPIAALGFDFLTPDQRDALAEACAEFLKRPHDRPFLLVASFINPHDICYMRVDKEHCEAAPRDLCGPAFAPGKRKGPQLKALDEALKPPAGVPFDGFIDKYCPPLPPNYGIPPLESSVIAPHRAWSDKWDDQKWRLHRWAYHRLTEMVDAQIGRVLAALRAAGLEENTVVFFSSDHGDMDASHHLEHKSVLYEESARVPFVVSHKGVTKAGLVDKTHFVSAGPDLIPTMCDYAGIAPPPGLPGRSVRALAEGRDAPPWRDQIVSETLHGRMVRTARYKYIIYDSGEHPEMLFDLQEDPGEMKNLAEEERFKDVLADHRRRLARWIAETGDRPAQSIVPAGG
jgi:choline-sulfatase